MIPLKSLSGKRPILQKYANQTKQAEMIKRLNASVIAKLPEEKVKKLRK